MKEDKSFFRVKLNEPVNENKGILFNAEVYNASYELVNDPDVNLIITDSSNKTYPFMFNKNANAYQLNAGIFSLGKYKYNASVKLGNKQYQKSGSFTVIPVNNEAINLVADYNLLYRIASSHEGSIILPGKLERIINILNERDDIHSVSMIQKRFTDLIGNLWLFILLLLLLTAEWAIRKRNGL